MNGNVYTNLYDTMNLTTALDIGTVIRLIYDPF